MEKEVFSNEREKKGVAVNNLAEDLSSRTGMGMSYFSWNDKFSLNRNPFRDTIDTNLFFRTRQHEEAVVKTRIGIEDRHALILLTGDSGTGKTMVSQVVLRSLDHEKYETVFVFVHPGMGKGPLLKSILKELGVAKPGRYTSDLLSQLQEKSLELHAAGKRPVVFIDEAHFLKADALHLLRTLSNLETEEEKLVTVVLLAEDTLVRRLNASSYSSLRSRITFKMNLEPLTPEETEQYVKFRLLKCDVRAHLLTGDAYQVVHHFCNGVPREVNKLLYNGFMEAMASNNFSITPEILRRQVRR